MTGPGERRSSSVSVGGSGRRPEERDRFVGRVPELALLHAQLGRAREGTPGVVLVEGAAGMGKTALLDRFLIGEDGLRVLWASGDEGETRLPYAVLAQLVTALTDVSEPRADFGPAADPLLAGARFLELLGAAGEEPTAMVVDDAQWADSPSLQALTFALRRLRSDRILAVFAARDDQTALPEGLHRLAAGRSLHLVGLDGRRVGELAAAAGVGGLSTQAAERLREHSGGNPLHVRALLEELDPDVLRHPRGSLPAPRSFALLIRARLASCEPDARRLVEAAAVLGQRWPLSLAVRLGEVDDAVTALDQAVQARLLAAPVASVVPDVAFAHPLVRAAVHNDLSPARRAALHARAGELTDGPASLDHRIAAALIEDPSLASEVEAHARVEADAGANAAAAAHLAAAARLNPDPAARERLMLDELEVLLRAGSVTEAAGVAAGTGGFVASARRSYLLGRLAFLGGRQAEAEELFLDAWERRDRSADSGIGGPVAAHLAWLFSLHMRLSLVVEWAERAVAEGDAPHLDVPVRSLVMTSLGLAGRADEALAHAARLAAREPKLTGRDVEPLLGRGVVRMWTDDLVGARNDLSTASARPHLSGVPLVALGWLAEAEYRMGAWDDSVVHASLAVSLIGDTDQVWLAAFVHAMATWALAARGDWDRSGAHVRAAVEAARTLGDDASSGYASIAAAHLAFCRGDAAGVVDAIQPLRSLSSWQQVCEPGVMAWREICGDALVKLGHLEEAEDVMSGLEALALPRDRASSLAGAARVRGMLAMTRGETDSARREFALGHAHTERLTMPFDRALLEEAHGRFRRRIGERRRAAGLLQAALDGFTRLGARPFADRCLVELEACGLSRRSRTAMDHLALTPQELAVSRLVATGRSNREVAAELVVSPKTVEYHLGHVFSKLGVRSRTQLAIHPAATGGDPVQGHRPVKD